MHKENQSSDDAANTSPEMEIVRITIELDDAKRAISHLRKERDDLAKELDAAKQKLLRYEGQVEAYKNRISTIITYYREFCCAI